MRAQSRYEGSPHLARPPAERGRLALPLSLLLVGVGYVLLVTGPLLSARLAPLLAGGLTSSTAALPAAASAGVALLGASAMVLVLARLVRDVDSHPYATLAPVLAVFSAFLLTSAKPTLPLAVWASQPLGLVVLTLALLGGALVAREQRAGRLFGWLLALLPFFLLTLVLALSVSGDPLTVLSQDRALQTYLSLLGSSALALALAGWLARTLASSHAPRADGAVHERGRYDTPVLLPMPESVQPAEPPLRLSTAQRHAPQAEAHAYAHAPADMRAGHVRAAVAPQRPRALAEARSPREPAVGPRLAQPRRARVASGERLRAPVAAPARAPSLEPRAPSLAAGFDSTFDEQAAIALMRPSGSRTMLWAFCGLLGVATSVAGYVLSRPPHSAPLRVEAAAAQAPLAAEPSPQPPLEVTAEPLVTEVVAPSAPAAAAPEIATAASVEATAEADAQAAARERRAARKQARAERRARAGASRAQTHEAEKVASAREEREGGEEKPRRARAAAAPEALHAARQEGDSAAVLGMSAPSQADTAGTQNERDLDLDQLVHKALNGSSGVSAADDPLLGL